MLLSGLIGFYFIERMMAVCGLVHSHDHDHDKKKEDTKVSPSKSKVGNEEEPLKKDKVDTVNEEETPALANKDQKELDLEEKKENN